MNLESRKKIRNRILGIGGLFTTVFAVVLFRSYQLQVVGNVQLDRLVKSQYNTNIVLEPKRGTIFDRNGNVLAMDIEVATIALNAKKVEDPQAVRSLLLKYTDISPKDLDEKLASGKTYDFVQRRIPIENGNAIQSQNLKGIIVEKEYRRFYPNKELAGQLLGAVGYDAKALGGIEMTYDEYLRSREEKRKAAKDARGKLFSWDEDVETQHDLYLSLDLAIQHWTEEALQKQAEQHKVRKGFAIVLDSQTGEILAMANYPTFNPNVYWNYPSEQWKNHAVIDAFEPGSTFKTLIMAAALDTKKVKAGDKFDCEGGSYRIGSNVIHDSHAHGVMTASEILKVSSNIGMTKIAFKVGKKTIYEKLKQIGIGEKSQLGLSGEPTGVFRNYEKWGDIEFSNIAFGQGVTVNGLQMITAYSMLAKGGDLIRPHLLKKIVDSSGETVYSATPKLEKGIVSTETAAAVAEMLHSVTQEGGTATSADLTGYAAAGKTGTAQMLDPATKTYSDTKFMSSFIGFAPLENPRLVIYAAFETTKGFGHFGGVVAAPVFKEVAQKSLTYLGVAPENANAQTLFPAPQIAQQKP